MHHRHLGLLGPHPWEKRWWQEARVGGGIGNQGDVDVVGSLNCMEWSLLPPATDEMMTQTSVVKGRFMGDPSHEYEYTELQKVNEGDKVFEEEIVVSEYERGGGPEGRGPGASKTQPNRNMVTT